MIFLAALLKMFEPVLWIGALALAMGKLFGLYDEGWLPVMLWVLAALGDSFYLRVVRPRRGAG